MTLLATALAWHDAGASVVPVRADGTKAPAVGWKQYQTTRATVPELETWFVDDQHGIGVICGAVSEQLEMLELEGRAVDLVTDLAQLMGDNGQGDLWGRLVAGMVEVSPSGGIHWFYKVIGGAARPNTKLARQLVDDQIEVLAETRGEGGFVVIAPSAGPVHDSGKPWTVLTGTPAGIPYLTVDERDTLHAIVGMLDQMPAVDPQPTRRQGGPDTGGTGTRPGDAYNTEATWEDILTPHGWKPVQRFSGNCIGWRRPGKNIGISATTGRNDADNLYVFTTSTTFNAEQPYSKFAAYAHLEHHGDYSAAAKALHATGYGTNAEQRRPTPVIDGTAAVASDPEPAPTAPHLVVVEPVTYSRTDDGNALRLVDTHADRIRYVPERGAWLIWNDTRWRWDTADHTQELARQLARNLPAGEDADIKHRRRTLNRYGLTNMLAVAQTDPRIVAPLETLDADPYALNTPGGLVELRTGKVSPPSPEQLHTRTTTVPADFDTTPERWLRFLATTFAGDPAVTTYVQRLLGVSLIGTVLEQILPFCYGEGANGKTTLLGAVQRVIGIGSDGYSQSAPAEILLATKNADHPTEIAGLAGARMVVTSELEDGQRFAEAKVKLLTGRDPLSARFMRQDYFTFTPTHSLWLLANHEPTVRAGGLAFWRRIRKVPFLHTIPAAERDKHLEERLVDEEGPAILGWLITGARDYLQHGLDEPDAVTKATDAYATDQDTVGRFVTDSCQTGDINAPHLRVPVPALRAAYETWCRQEGEQPVSPRALTLALRSRYGIESERSKSTRYYYGIKLEQVSPDDELSVTDDDDKWGR